MNLEEWKWLCCKSWQIDFDYLQIDRFAKIGEGTYTIRECNKHTYVEFTPETKPFQFLYLNMIYAREIKDDLKDLEKLNNLQSKVKHVRLVEKLSKQGYHYDISELFEPVTDTIKNTCEDITKTITETSIKNNKALESLNEKVLELMTHKGMVAPYLASSLVILCKPGNRSQFRLGKGVNLKKMYEFLIHRGIPVTLYSNMVTFRDSEKSFELDGDLLKLMTNSKFNADLSNPQDRKIVGEFAGETNYDAKSTCKPSIRHCSIIRRLSSTAIIASGICTIFLPSDPNEFCKRLRSIIQEKQNESDKIQFDGELFAIVDKLLEDKCITPFQHKKIFKKINLLKHNIGF